MLAMRNTALLLNVLQHLPCNVNHIVVKDFFPQKEFPVCVISGEKNDNVNVEEKSGIVQVTVLKNEFLNCSPF